MLRRPVVQQLVLIGVAAVVFFTNLGGIRLMDRDEPRNAGCAAEMLARNDWVVPTFNAELRTHKPVLTYWFMMAGYKAFGVTEFGARFWSAVLGIGTVLMTYHIGRRLFNAAVGFWAGLVTSTALWFAVASRIATPDSVLVFFSTLPILIYVLAAFEPRDEAGEDVQETRLRRAAEPFPRAWWVSLAMYAAMGMAILAKGPVGIVLPTAVVGMFLLIVRRPEGPTSASGGRLRRVLGVFAPLNVIRAGWSMRPLTAVVVALAVSLPWYVLVHQRTGGAWTRGFFLEHNLGRATNAMEGHGGGGLLYVLYLLYYPVVTLVAFLPWSVFLIESLMEAGKRLARRDPWRLGYILALCWIGVYLVAFSIAATKLPSYVTPMYPALGLIVAAYVYQLCRGAQLTGARGPVHIFWLVVFLGAAALIAAPLAAPAVLPGSGWLGALGLLPIGAGAACLVLYRKGRRGAAMGVFGAAAVVFTTGSLAGVLWYLDRTYQKRDVLLEAIRRNCDQPTIGCLGVLEPSWVFYAKQPIHEFHGDETGAAIAALESSAAYLITTSKDEDELKPRLPAGVVELARVPWYMRPGKPDLVVLGRQRSTPARSAIE